MLHVPLGGLLNLVLIQGHGLMELLIRHCCGGDCVLEKDTLSPNPSPTSCGLSWKQGHADVIG